MQRSSDYFLTTHVGSLPRPDDLVQTMHAKEQGVPVDPEALAVRIRDAVQEVVDIQVRCGVTVIDDGEMSKPSYATYVKDRLTGFGGTGTSYIFQDLVDFPELRDKIFADPGRARRKTPACNGPITVKDDDSVRIDLETLHDASAGKPIAETFMSAASPGVVSLFFRNDYYPSHEDYLYAIAEAMRPEYEAIAASGTLLQVDCPDLAMGRHVQYAELELPEFRKRMQMHIEALNHALRNIPADRLRMHLCWGNYGGPHVCDVPLKDIIDLVWTAKPSGICFEAANPRHAHEWELFENTTVPDGKVLIPGVIESQTNYVEHPELIAQRIGRYAALVGRENVIAGSDCGYSIHVGQASVDRRVVWAKLEALAEGARIASAKFWS